MILTSLPLLGHAAKLDLGDLRQQLFDKLDTDRNGKIEEAEFTGVSAQNASLSDDALKRMFSALEPGADKAASVPESRIGAGRLSRQVLDTLLKLQEAPAAEDATSGELEQVSPDRLDQDAFAAAVKRLRDNPKVPGDGDQDDAGAARPDDDRGSSGEFFAALRQRAVLRESSGVPEVGTGGDDVDTAARIPS